jgi:hypothetical protein
MPCAAEIFIRFLALISTAVLTLSSGNHSCRNATSGSTFVARSARQGETKYPCGEAS